MIFTKTKLVANILFSKKGVVLLIPLAVTVNVIDAKLALLVLFVLMTLDFITGISASYVERKELIKTLKGAELENLKKTNLISSQKLKMSGVKFALYMITTLLAFAIESIFFIKSFNLKFSEAELTVSVVVIFFWCCVEIYSIIFENFKKMGFDITAKVLNIFKKYKSLKSKI